MFIQKQSVLYNKKQLARPMQTPIKADHRYQKSKITSINVPYEPTETDSYTFDVQSNGQVKIILKTPKEGLNQLEAQDISLGRSAQGLKSRFLSLSHCQQTAQNRGALQAYNKNLSEAYVKNSRTTQNQQDYPKLQFQRYNHKSKTELKAELDTSQNNEKQKYENKIKYLQDHIDELENQKYQREQYFVKVINKNANLSPFMKSSTSSIAFSAKSRMSARFDANDYLVDCEKQRQQAKWIEEKVMKLRKKEKMERKILKSMKCKLQQSRQNTEKSEVNSYLDMDISAVSVIEGESPEEKRKQKLIPNKLSKSHIVEANQVTDFHLNEGEMNGKYPYILSKAEPTNFQKKQNTDQHNERILSLSQEIERKDENIKKLEQLLESVQLEKKKLSQESETNIKMLMKVMEEEKNKQVAAKVSQTRQNYQQNLRLKQEERTELKNRVKQLENENDTFHALNKQLQSQTKTIEELSHHMEATINTQKIEIERLYRNIMGLTTELNQCKTIKAAEEQRLTEMNIKLKEEVDSLAKLVQSTNEEALRLRLLQKEKQIEFNVSDSSRSEIQGQDKKKELKLKEEAIARLEEEVKKYRQLSVAQNKLESDSHQKIVELEVQKDVLSRKISQLEGFAAEKNKMTLELESKQKIISDLQKQIEHHKQENVGIYIELDIANRRSKQAQDKIKRMTDEIKNFKSNKADLSLEQSVSSIKQIFKSRAKIQNQELYGICQKFSIRLIEKQLVKEAKKYLECVKGFEKELSSYTENKHKIVQGEKNWPQIGIVTTQTDGSTKSINQENATAIKSKFVTKQMQSLTINIGEAQSLPLPETKIIQETSQKKIYIPEDHTLSHSHSGGKLDQLQVSRQNKTQFNDNESQGFTKSIHSQMEQIQASEEMKKDMRNLKMKAKQKRRKV